MIDEGRGRMSVSMGGPRGSLIDRNPLPSDGDTLSKRAANTGEREPAGPEVIRVPGGERVAKAVAALGFFVTAVSIVLACVPPDDEPNKLLAVVKVVGSSAVLVGIGLVVYGLGRKR